MMLAAHLFSATPAGGTADEETLEGALDSAMSEADNELQGRWDTFTISQRRALTALAHGEQPFSKVASLLHGTSKGATGKALARLAAGADITPEADHSWSIVDPFIREWIRRLGTRS